MNAFSETKQRLRVKPVVQILRYVFSTALLCCSIVWWASHWMLAVAAVPGPASDLSVSADRHGWILQNASATGEAPFFRVFSLSGSNRPDWAGTTDDATWRLSLPGIVIAVWNSAPCMSVEMIGVRHWMAVLLLCVCVLLTMYVGRRSLGG